MPPVVALSRVFRGKFTAVLQSLYRANKLQFHSSLQQVASPQGFQRFLQTLFASDWVVYAKPPFGGPDQVLKYLARYTHRVAISNYRLVDFRDGRVSFLWRDYTHGAKQKVMTLAAHEFLRRFLLHVLPGGLVRIRHFGLFANRKRGATLVRCRMLLAASALTDLPPLPQPRCPSCAGVMLIVERLSCAQLYFRMHPPVPTGNFLCRFFLMIAIRFRSSSPQRSDTPRSRGRALMIEFWLCPNVNSPPRPGHRPVDHGAHPLKNGRRCGQCAYPELSWRY